MTWLPGYLHTSRGSGLSRGGRSGSRSRGRLRSSGGGGSRGTSLPRSGGSSSGGDGLLLSRSLGLILLRLLAAEDGLEALLDLGERVGS